MIKFLKEKIAKSNGAAAFRGHIDPDDNPYHGETQGAQARAWHAGWVKEAKRSKSKKHRDALDIVCVISFVWFLFILSTLVIK